MIVADEDHIYIESFAQYIRNSEYSTRFDIKLFSKQEAITQFYQAGEKSNILLATSNILPQDLTDEMFDQVIYLSENEEHHNSKHHLKKYQPLSQLISEVLQDGAGIAGFDDYPTLESFIGEIAPGESAAGQIAFDFFIEDYYELAFGYGMLSSVSNEIRWALHAEDAE